MNLKSHWGVNVAPRRFEPDCESVIKHRKIRIFMAYLSTLMNLICDSRNDRYKDIQKKKKKSSAQLAGWLAGIFVFINYK